MLNSHLWGDIFGPLKSDLGVFWPFRGTDFIMGKNKNANFSKSPNGPILKFFLVQNGLYSCPTYSTTCFMLNSHPGGYFSRAWFYNGQKQKCKFLKKPSWPDSQFFCGDSWGNFTKNGTNLSIGEFFFGFDLYKPLCIGVYRHIHDKCFPWRDEVRRRNKRNM